MSAAAREMILLHLMRMNGFTPQHSRHGENDTEGARAATAERADDGRAYFLRRLLRELAQSGMTPADYDPQLSAALIDMLLDLMHMNGITPQHSRHGENDTEGARAATAERADDGRGYSVRRLLRDLAQSGMTPAFYDPQLSTEANLDMLLDLMHVDLEPQHSRHGENDTEGARAATAERADDGRGYSVRRLLREFPRRGMTPADYDPQLSTEANIDMMLDLMDINGLTPQHSRHANQNMRFDVTPPGSPPPEQVALPPISSEPPIAVSPVSDNDDVEVVLDYNDDTLSDMLHINLSIRVSSGRRNAARRRRYRRE